LIYRQAVNGVINYNSSEVKQKNWFTNKKVIGADVDPLQVDNASFAYTKAFE